MGDNLAEQSSVAGSVLQAPSRRNAAHFRRPHHLDLTPCPDEAAVGRRNATSRHTQLVFRPGFEPPSFGLLHGWPSSLFNVAAYDYNLVCVCVCYMGSAR